MFQSNEPGTMRPDRQQELLDLARSSRDRADRAVTWLIASGREGSAELLLSEPKHLWPWPDYSPWVSPEECDDLDNPFHPVNDASLEMIRTLRAIAATYAIAAETKSYAPLAKAGIYYPGAPANYPGAPANYPGEADDTQDRGR